MVFALILSLFAPALEAQVAGYNYPQTYNQNVFTQGYGNNAQVGAQGYDPRYYNYGYGQTGGHGFTRLIPQAVGAVMGLAIGAKFGIVGALVGGAIGFFGGKAISTAIFGDGYYPGSQGHYFSSSNMANSVPGMIGAMLGAFMGSGLGPVGMLIGGGIGYLVAKGIARVMFPNSYYGSNYALPGYGVGYGGYPYASQTQGSLAVRASDAAAASPSSSSDLADLKQAFYDAMQAYKAAVEGGDQAEIEAKYQAYVSARKVYFDKKGLALDSVEEDLK